MYKEYFVCSSEAAGRLVLRLRRQKSIVEKGLRAKVTASSGPKALPPLPHSLCPPLESLGHSVPLTSRVWGVRAACSLQSKADLGARS